MCIYTDSWAPWVRQSKKFDHKLRYVYAALAANVITPKQQEIQAGYDCASKRLKKYLYGMWKLLEEHENKNTNV